MTRIRVKNGQFRRPSAVEEGAVLSVFRVPPERAGQRLDVFLHSELRRTSRTRAQFIIQNSAYDEGGRRLRPSHRVRADERILLWRAAWDEDPVPTDMRIVFEDDHLLAINKPAGLPVHPTARYYRNTVTKSLEAERPGEFLALGHRIDRETSGVLLIAKDAECERRLKTAFERRVGIDKIYLAITWNTPAFPSGGKSFRLERSLELDPESRYKVKMRLGETERALHAATRFVIEETRRRGDREYALVRCELETGRQHQIRVHLQSLGAPIVGDKLYGPDEALFARGADGELTDDDREILELERHALHAHVMRLAHPMTGQPLTIEAPLPSDLLGFWDELDPDDAA